MASVVIIGKKKGAQNCSFKVEQMDWGIQSRWWSNKIKLATGRRAKKMFTARGRGWACCGFCCWQRSSYPEVFFSFNFLVFSDFVLKRLGECVGRRG